MAHLWMKDSEKNWAVLPLLKPCYTLADQKAYVPLAKNGPADGEAVRFLRVNSKGLERWVIVAGAGRTSLTLNGWPLATGLAVLCDKDEIRLSRVGRLYFSTERVPVIEPFPEQNGGPPTRCPRCRQEILSATDVVRCPKCSVYFHSTVETPCWIYSPFCICGRATDLEAGYEWVPHGI